MFPCLEGRLAAGSDIDDRLIGVKRVSGGALQDSFLLDGVAFKKTFSYAGFEQQPKRLLHPKIACLNLELELKAERDNAEIRVNHVTDYQAMIDAEWQLLFDRMESIKASGATVVLSKLAIGDVATQWLADRGMFGAGRVPADDLQRVCIATGAQLLTCVDQGVQSSSLGTCAVFEERQLGSERFNYFEGCPVLGACTIILRGGAEAFLDEVHRSLHDALMVVRRTRRHSLARDIFTSRDETSDDGTYDVESGSHAVVAGGGATEMDLARHLRQFSRGIPGCAQLAYAAFARAFECIPRQLAENAGLDSIGLLASLRKLHSVANNSDTLAGDDDSSLKMMGLSLATNYDDNEQVSIIRDTFEEGIWEPALVKTNAIAAACEAACMILSVDLSVVVKPNNPAGGSGDFSKMAARAGLPR